MTRTLPLLGLLALLVGSQAGCVNGHSTADAAAPGSAGADALVRVTPIMAVKKKLVRYTEQPGQIAAMEETPIVAKISGYVRRIHVDIGDRVKGPVYDGDTLMEPGQPLIEIDVPEMHKEHAQKLASIQQAKSEIKQSQAAIKVAKAMGASSEALVAEAQASIDRVNADFERRKSELARMTDLAARQAVTDKLVDEATNQYRAAEAAQKEIAAKVKSAQAQRDEAGALVEKAEADLEAAHAKLGVAEADEQRLAAMLQYTTIRAPFDGVVSARDVDTGHLVSASSTRPLLVVVMADTVRAVVDVPEIDAVHIEPGVEATLRMPSLAGGEFTGTVTRSTWVLNQSTRTLRTEIDIPNPDGKLRPGMYAHARIKVAEKPAALILPKTAILTSAGQSFCWRIEEDGSLVRHPIQTGIESGGDVEILSGLSGSEPVVGLNASSFREGQRVEVAEPAGPAGG
ncbi:MAG: efflux RND transporter periplasmic adaptor subunit [Pirellulaceae bacterium]